MKLSKKYEQKVKKRILNTLASIALVTTTLATMKLADFPMPKIEIKALGDKSENISLKSVTIAEDGAIVCDSIMQGVSAIDLEDGDYVLRVTGKNTNGTQETIDYEIELVNYRQNMTYSLENSETSKTVNLGNSTADERMLVVKYWGDLTVDSGVTLTATTRKKGMYIHVEGTTINNGTISMTARGSKAEGENVYLWKNVDDSFEYIPSVGASGVPAKGISSGYIHKGIRGNDGTNRATAGGGQGGKITNTQKGAQNSYIGASSAGTSYAGGNGSGGMVRCNTSALAASYTQASATAGGNGYAYDAGSTTYYFAGGGAGITGGSSDYCRIGTTNTETKGQDGAGGLLILYTNVLKNDGTISSNGSNGAGASCSLTGSYRGAVGGGGSGGGSVNIFYKRTTNIGNVIANGGNGGDVSKCTNSNMGLLNGGNGGNGSVTITNLLAELNYEEKEINLNINETYKIDTTKLKLVNQNSLQVINNLNIQGITYEISNDEIATVTSDGTIVGKKIGTTKLKIVDTTNNLETYIYINIINGINAQLSSGNNFTIALKENGTVWSFGKNDNGQLGNGNNEDCNIPVQVKSDDGNDVLNNITQIATGTSHSVALAKDGTIYTWGLNQNGQLGNGEETNSNIPVKITDLKNIVKVDAYKNTTTAIDSDGKVYIWGENYSNLPMKLIYSTKMVDVSGDIFLSREGMVYNISDLENPISGISRIAKIACGENHYLALTVNGYVYSWGDNTYGQLAKNTTDAITTPIATDIIELEAGVNTSLIKTEENELYVAGNNANGLIGLNTQTNASELTKIELTEEIEFISQSEGTNSVISDINGFVYTTGTNTYGELGDGNNTEVTEFKKIGETKIVTDEEILYIDIGEQQEIIYELINTFNLKVDTVDNIKQNFTVSIPDTTKLKLEDYNIVTALDYSVNKITITHNETKKTKEITIKIVKKMDDIIKGLRDTDLSDGNYEIMVSGESYNIELYNYYEDMVYSLDEGETEKIVYLGNDTPDETMLVVKYHGNLRVDKGVTLIPTVRKKGMYVCVLGDLVNSGEITMTARGASVEEGQDVYLWKNIDDSYEYVPADGASGLEEYQPLKTRQGNKGNDGTNRQTGGGGQSGAIINGLKGSTESYVGASTGGNSYSGGNGTGGLVRCNIAAIAGSYTQATSTAGGNASAYDANTKSSYFAGGGAGLTGGTSSYNRVSTTGIDSQGESGTGGLLMLYTNSLENKGVISSEGSQGAGGSYAFGYTYNGAVGGSGSGGGSINIFANTIVNVGNVSAEGGLGGVVTGTRANMGLINGAQGGEGSSTINELGSVLNYAKKNITLEIEETYSIDTSKITYTKLNDIQTEDLIVGNLNYESLDTSIATVNSNGKITGLATGKTKIKITDLDNGYYTYIIVNVTKKGLVIPQIEEGIDYTVVLKANGTVWSYGENSNGQLGNNSTVSSNEPIEVLTENLESLKNIVDIGAGYNCGIALSNDGEVYTWGLYKYKDSNGSAQSQNRLVATKEPLLHNIVKVESYKNNFYAIDADGIAYIWGEGYDKPTKIETAVGIEDISGDILLGQDGLVYLVSNPTERLEYLSNICEVSCGEDHYLFLALDGYIYSLGKNDLGQRR